MAGHLQGHTYGRAAEPNSLALRGGTTALGDHSVLITIRSKSVRAGRLLVELALPSNISKVRPIGIYPLALPGRTNHGGLLQAMIKG